MVEQIRQTEFQENNSLAGRNVLVTGARSSIAKDIVDGIIASNGNVIAGSRKEFGQLYIPFKVDLLNPQEIEEGMSRLIEDTPPTDIVLSAAAGLESILTMDLTRNIIQYSKAIGHKKEEKRQFLEELIREHIDDGHNDALQVNSLSNQQIIRLLREKRTQLPEVVRVIYLSSFWSDLYGKIDIPLLYSLVAKTKHDFLDFLDRKSESLASEGIYTAVVSGHLIPETETGGQLKRLGERLPDIISFDEQYAFPTVRDMSGRVIELLTENPMRWPSYPNRKYITGVGKVEDTMYELHPALASVQITI